VHGPLVDTARTDTDRRAGPLPHPKVDVPLKRARGKRYDASTGTPLPRGGVMPKSELQSRLTRRESASANGS
jgi:hypothetical protein